MILNSRLSCFRRSSVHAEKNRVQNRNYKSRPEKGGVHKTVNPPYGQNHTEIIYVYDSNLLAATVCKKPANPQGIAALAVQESVDTLTERSDEHSQSGCFSLPTENEARRMHDTPDRRV